MSFVARVPPPTPEPLPPTDEERVPGKYYLLATFGLAGLYYTLIFMIPGQATADAGSTWSLVLSTARAAEAHPVLFGSMLLATLAPAAIFPFRARPYLMRLTVLVLILWGGLFAALFQPQATRGVEALLHQPRDLPETIKERPEREP